MNPFKYVLITILALVLTSCNLDMNFGQVRGNGNVVTENRQVTEHFDKVKGSTGLDIFLTEGNENKIVVEADENLMEYIETNINNGKLTIRSSKSIGRSKSKKVHVTFKKLISIEASSGADIMGNSVIKSETLNLEASSGADLEVEVFAKYLYAETHSGADMVLSGRAINFNAKASSGSDLEAKKLIALDCNANASSGADITVNVKDKLDAKASSGGDVGYYGNPAAVSKDRGSSGTVRKM